jgi:putative transposase
MIRTHTLPCTLPQVEADALNQESARIYTGALVEHYRVYRQTGHWLTPTGLEHLCDAYDRDRPRLLHAHSVDAAQQGFVKACRTARVCRALGPGTHYPYQRKRWRTTIWKATGLRRQGDTLLLARARGLAPIALVLPDELRAALAVREVRLAWDRVARRYTWHVVVEDGRRPRPAPGTNTVAVDLGEIHPATLSDGQVAVVISARALRANQQHTHKRLAELRHSQDAKVQDSRRWRKLQRRKHRFLAQQKRRARDIEHKVSRAVVDCALERQAGTLAVGDVRDIADGKRLGAHTQQKISTWAHGRLRDYITYKAAAEGIAVVLIDESYTTQTCPHCGQRHKPAGRIFRCPDCEFQAHRDGVGAANILSRHLYGQLGQVRPPPRGNETYRHPFGKLSFRTGKRSRLDTAQVA